MPIKRNGIDLPHRKLHIGPQNAEEQAAAPNCDKHARCSAQDRQKQAFGEQLACDPPGWSAERAPDGKFLLAGCSASQHQISNVHTCDQQDEANRGQKSEHRVPETFQSVVAQGLDRAAHSRVVVRVLFGDARCYDRYFRTRLSEGHARLEARNRTEAVLGAGIIGFGVAHWYPELERTAVELPGKLKRHYAHHGEILAIDFDWTAHNRSVASVTLLPQAIAQDDFSRSAKKFFLRRKRAP